MKNILKIAVTAFIAVAMTRMASAVPISGNIGFSGSATLDSGNVSTATKVVSWGTNSVYAESGNFSAFIALGTQVTLAAPWTFNTPLPGINNFWQVGGFTFNLLTSSGSLTTVGGQTFLDVVITGTVSGNGFDTTAFSGTFQTANPSANGVATFTDRFSFAPVPDGGTTVLLLGAALSGLALIKRRFMA